MAAMFRFCILLSAVAIPNIALSETTALNTEMTVLSSTTKWTNSSGSTMVLALSPAAAQPYVFNVSGHYVNKATGFGCQGTSFPLSGVYYSNTQVISFSVAWSNSSQDCQSVTGWTGYFDFLKPTPELIADWNLAFKTANGKTIMQGNDVFK